MGFFMVFSPENNYEYRLYSGYLYSNTKASEYFFQMMPLSRSLPADGSAPHHVIIGKNIVQIPEKYNVENDCDLKPGPAYVSG